MIRQPIVTVAGHVDHGKTSLLDRFRGSAVAAGEAGGITQKISFTRFPQEEIVKRCPLIQKQGISLEIPGFLFIDTPGHAAFTNLRKRGGSLADLAILVIDINEGIMPQTAEVLQIFKNGKTPFIIALNKVDNISGWRKQGGGIQESIESQAVHARQDFDEKLFTLIGALHSHGFEADLFYNITDFTKKVALVPCSARTLEGIAEILFVLCGLSQKFLKEKIKLKEEAKGVILEMKREKALAYAEAILYDGILHADDEIAVASFDEPVVTRIRALEEIQPLSYQFKPVKEARAAAGLRMQLVSKEEILPGMPFTLYKGNSGQIAKEFKKELAQIIQLEKEGIIIKAESLGSLEALLHLLKMENISVSKAGIGKINKGDISAARARLEKDITLSVILGFNVDLDEEAKSIQSGVKILSNDVIYRLIEDLKKWQEGKRKEIDKQRMMGISSVAKIELLPNFVFRNSKPAVFGVRVLLGRLKPDARMIDENNEEMDKIKKIQHENTSLEEATAGMEVAISLPNTTFDRQLKDKKFLYTDVGEAEFRKFKDNKDLLSSDELSVLQEIAQIKRRFKIAWGV